MRPVGPLAALRNILMLHLPSTCRQQERGGVLSCLCGEPCAPPFAFHDMDLLQTSAHLCVWRLSSFRPQSLHSYNGNGLLHRLCRVLLHWWEPSVDLHPSSYHLSAPMRPGIGGAGQELPYPLLHWPHLGKAWDATDPMRLFVSFRCISMGPGRQFLPPHPSRVGPDHSTPIRARSLRVRNCGNACQAKGGRHLTSVV